MNDAERIEAAIDRPHDQLLLLADIHGEAGKDVLAEGYRLLAKHRRWPELIGRERQEKWQWRLLLGWTSKQFRMRLPHDAPLPEESYPTPSAALRAAALALAWWKRGWKIHIVEPMGDPPYRVMCGERLLGEISVADPAFGGGWQAQARRAGGGCGFMHGQNIEALKAWVVRDSFASQPLPESSR